MLEPALVGTWKLVHDPFSPLVNPAMVSILLLGGEDPSSLGLELQETCEGVHHSHGIDILGRPALVMTSIVPRGDDVEHSRSFGRICR